MRGYAETTGCRRRFILHYFGEDAPERCDRCDSCDRRGSTAPRLGGKARFPDRSLVRHRELGRGMVLRREGSSLVVLFTEGGEKRLSPQALGGRASSSRWVESGPRRLFAGIRSSTRNASAEGTTRTSAASPWSAARRRRTF